ncbi:hypothetical protein FISHEDRAFT_74390 [Fistulina hepatica ATCC 64428]|uniref:Uncharacterized protein n=1 Tax=Fistulina hepatica ATCC 64428 TaxID=1128425 RepID=A0A0D7ABD0_9AGAR|nr:hypothetical protein FISHEDRAFT_74390 [Fistulina hepatica ATCC 64428]
MLNSRWLLWGSLILARLDHALSGIFPTQPIETTVFSVGRLAEVTWIDDYRPPRLGDIGPVRIDLYSTNDTFITTVARGIDPTALSQTIDLSPDLDYLGDTYNLRFFPYNKYLRSQVVYTADFVIANTTKNTPIVPLSDEAGIGNSTQTQQPLTIKGTNRLLTLVLPSTTLVTQLAKPTLQPNISSYTTVTADSLENHGSSSVSKDGDSEPFPQGRSRNSAAFKLDLEKLKFQLVFIVWPAMIGISMAM